MYGIAVFGCGYVGLVTAACLANLGHRVYAYDADAAKIRSLERGDIPFYEPGLQQLVSDARANGRLYFVGQPQRALSNIDIVFIAVGTPTGPTGEADLTYVRHAARDIAVFATAQTLVVNKSTVPVETADMVERCIAREAKDAHRFIVASNPEFLREGSAVSDFLHPDRVVVGTASERAREMLRELYAPLGAPIHFVDVHTAEMIKYAANAFLAMKVSFINEIANVCSAVDADIEGVVAGIGADARIGATYLQPGLGFGGSCLPKDVAALAHVARSHAIEPTMLDATLAVNRRQIARAVQLIEDIAGDLYGRRIAVAGLAFKGGTDDVRESPAITLVQALVTRGACVAVYDAMASARARGELGDRVRYAQSVYEAARGAEALVIATDDRTFTRVDFPRIRALLASPRVIDLRNRLDAAAVRQAGLTYTGVGRARVKIAS